MKRHIMLAGFCIACFFLLSWYSSLACPQETPRKAKLQPKAIEGVWIQVCKEIEGEMLSMLPVLRPRLNAPISGYYLWKISDKTIEMGPDRKNEFPLYRQAYKLNPGNQEDAIDLLPLDEAKVEKKGLAIYYVKDDYLMICVGRGSRPKSFTSSKNNPNWVYVLRRKNIKLPGFDSDNPKRKGK